VGSEPTILSVAALLWLAGFLILGRIRAQGPPPLRPPRPVRQASKTSSSPQAGEPAVSIIIPARNEAHNLPALLLSISAQSIAPLEILVVDDASADRTAEVAVKLGASVVASQPLPEGWRGKTWACHQGAAAARGDILLFVDADTWFEKGGLEHVLASYRAGALSLGPYHATRKPYEQLSAFFNLIMAAATVPHGLFGQMLMVDRESYRCVGGHEAVRGRVLENHYLAGKFREAGIPVNSRVGRGAIGFRMYPNGLSELIEGWAKGFASGAGRTAKPRLLLIVAWLTGLMLPLGWLPSSALAWLVYLLFAVQLLILFRQVGSFRWYAALLYPVPLAFFVALFAWSFIRPGRQVTWKGRSFHAG